MTEDMQQEIEQLQFKVAFQEDAIEQLSQQLANQQQQMDKMAFQLKHVIDKLKQVQVSTVSGDGNEPPPHY
jgi:SlyX protein